MFGELVRVRTRDNVYLHGLISKPEIEPQLQLDAAICIHGLGGNFYASRLNLRLGQMLLGVGLTVAQINTRGHDDINQSTRDGRTINIGAAYELVDECRHDLHAWLDLLVEQGKQRIALVGHSLGAIKSIYSQAIDRHEAVAAIVAVSASRLSYSRFLDLPSRDKFLETYGRAKQLMQQGSADSLMRIEFPFPTFMTAGAYCDKYGPDDRYNWLRYASDITDPVLLVFGEMELQENAAFMGILEEIQGLNLGENYETQTIEGANHFYAARQDDLAAAIKLWLNRRFRC